VSHVSAVSGNAGFLGGTAPLAVQQRDDEWQDGTDEHARRDGDSPSRFPVDNFYELKKTATGKQPYAIALADRQLMALAGLWETWRSPGGPEGAQLRDHYNDAERAVCGAS
jgi:SOS response associated peptidase (SRAP)